MTLIVTYHGDVETTSFFMTRIEEKLKADGYKVAPLFYNEDLAAWLRGRDDLSQAVFLTFNFAGIYTHDACFMPGSKGRFLADAFAMHCINILVDHPYHYHDFLYEQIRLRSSRYSQFCIDRAHLAYMKEYFPELPDVSFLPSGGTGYKAPEEKPQEPDLSARPIDLLFAGTYVAPDSFDVFIDRNGPEYSAFYHSILDEAIADPSAKLDEITRRRMEEEIEEGFTKEELRLTLGHIQFLDYYVRYSRRAGVIRSLADYEETDPETGAKRYLSITIVGSGWEGFVKSLKHPERITLLPYADSREVLRLLSQSRLSLNILPSFHEGAHDRIFNAMLCGAVCVTDTNPYLDALLKDGENALIYGFSENGEAVMGEDFPAKTLIRLLLPENHPALQRIADCGRAFAAEHTWEKRVAAIEALFREEADDGGV